MNNTKEIISPAPLLVNIEDVWVQYEGKWVLKSIFLKCYEGEILGIVGPNGCLLYTSDAADE